MTRWNTMPSRCHGSLFTFHERGRQTSERASERTNEGRKEEASTSYSHIYIYIRSGETSSKDRPGRAAKGRSWSLLLDLRV